MPGKTRTRPVMSKVIAAAMAFWLAFMPAAVYAGSLEMTALPEPGVMVARSETFVPAVFQGLKFFPDDPLRFEFLLRPGDASERFTQHSDELRGESEKLIRYFLSALTIPEKDLWVNLSPYEQERVIPDEFGLTEMGRDLLEEDYILKQLSSSLLYPAGDVGKEFWKRVYGRAFELYGTTDIPTETFNKVWIVPDVARVYEDAVTNTVVIVESHLKVMLEGDYVALAGAKTAGRSSTDGQKELVEISTRVFRDVVLPAIEKEVNEDKNFARLRQVFHALILAKWFKTRLKGSVLGQGYANQKKMRGIDLVGADAQKHIYARYVEAYRKGVYNYIAEETDPYSGDVLPRKYFSGGVNAVDIPLLTNGTRGEANQVMSKELKAVLVKFIPTSFRKTIGRLGRGLFISALAFLVGACSSLDGRAKLDLFTAMSANELGAMTGHRSDPGAMRIHQASKWEDVVEPFRRTLIEAIHEEEEAVAMEPTRALTPKLKPGLVAVFKADCWRVPPAPSARSSLE